LTENLKQTSLYDEHVALGAAFTDFGGWQMPVRYTSDLTEHAAVRSAAGIFDISHMAEFFVIGNQAAEFLDHALVGVASEIEVGRAKYSLITDEQGRVLDDLIVYRLEPEYFLVISNAGNRETVAAAFANRTANFDVKLTDVSDEFSLIAVQGPLAVEIMKRSTDEPIDELKYYSIHAGKFAGSDAFFARTGYTGEDGFELLVKNADAVKVWRTLLETGASDGLIAAGYAARDTLRLEAGMPLYGHEMTLDTTPFEAGFAKVLRLEHDFVGAEPLRALSATEPSRRLVGLVGEGKRAARADYELFENEDGGTSVGFITSGALSPTLGYPVAMAYLNTELASPDTEVWVDVRGTRQPMQVVKLPFYKRKK
jgi:aminomethyltransferase